MQETNLYWAVYLNLEDEVLNITKYIHCDSSQKNVYSIAIADLIVRCAIEIEAISKIIYKNLGGDMEPKDDKGNNRFLFFDSDCLALIDKTYNIAKKKVIISSTAFFLDDSDRIIRPLKESHKMGQGNGCKWKDAYQALKHDRYDNLSKYGTVFNLIHALAALFILNLYLKDERYDLPDGIFDERVGSKVFSVIAYKADNLQVDGKKFNDSYINKPNGITLEESLYIIKLLDSNYTDMFNAFITDNKETIKRILESRTIRDFLAQHPNYEIKHPLSLITDAEGDQAVKKYLSIREFSQQIKIKKREAILNKGTAIYPEISNDDFSL